MDPNEKLAQQMDDIYKQYRVFEEDLNANTRIVTYLSRVNQWEHQSISKIQKSAEIARNDLLKILDRTKNQFQLTMEKVNVNRQTNDYTETDLNQLKDQLKQLEHLYQTSFNDEMIGERQSSISLIKILDPNPSWTLDQSFSSLPPENFDKFVGSIILSKDRLTATCSGSNWNGSTISGINLYSSGVHPIRFQIIKKGRNNLFFGITSLLKDSNPWNRKTPFAYGWWEIPFTPEEEQLPKDSAIQSGDQVTLTLDCITGHIQFEHHRTNRYIDERITDEQCPLPWRLAVVLYTPGDSVRILPT